MNRYVCIHGHFYQPPRENPWLEAIELQDSAYPFHDWNERIASECYERNSASRILDGDHFITDIVNNYSRISFNFGPTLLSWMAAHKPAIYESILEGDRESRERLSGHGSALAQPYNHLIMPLASRRDKETQVKWGIYDFRSRFGHDPEGMWLPETAVDVETLEVLAEHGIRFTILAPRQASRIRRIGTDDWEPADDERIDPTQAYLLHLPSGQAINLFFFDGPVSRAVAFEDLLTRGENLAERIMGGFSDETERAQLVNIATDGETFGHHHRFADMALAYAIHYIESNELARIVNYGYFLEQYPPEHEVEIIENSSWSCAHGIERWRTDCGCNSGGHPGWNQGWREPLRQGLDWLRDAIAPRFEEFAAGLLKDPWSARDDYIRVILDRSPENISDFLSYHATRPLEDDEKVLALKALEIQRHALLMYTSCGWFFDDISGIETVQIIQYAGRAIQLAEEVLNDSYETGFLERIEKARSNIPQHGNGRNIYRKFVKPAMVDLPWVAAHYGVSSLFEDYTEETAVYCYDVRPDDYQLTEYGKTRLAVGQLGITSRITLESGKLSFAVLHFGDQMINAGVRRYNDRQSYDQMVREISENFYQMDIAEVVRAVDRHFGSSTYSLRSLFRDEQRKVLAIIMQNTLDEIESIYRRVYESHYPLIRFFGDLGAPLPSFFHAVAELMINVDLRRELIAEFLDADRVVDLLENAAAWDIELDREGLGFTFAGEIDDRIRTFQDSPDEMDPLKWLVAGADIANQLPFEVNLWKIQNTYFDMMQRVYPEYRSMAVKGEDEAQLWVEQFEQLGRNLWIRVR